MFIVASITITKLWKHWDALQVNKEVIQIDLYNGIFLSCKKKLLESREKHEGNLNTFYCEKQFGLQWLWAA